MRVISGKYKGLKLDGFNIEGTRPTMDRVKESCFAMIQNKIKNSICLDLFAGSGSLGIEALSNGANFCYFVDNSFDIIKILNSNLKKINDNNYKVLSMHYKKALKKFNDEHIKFDIILLDPPYKLNLINQILNYIYESKLLNDNGIIICEFENELVQSKNFKKVKENKYGEKKVQIYSY